MPKGDRRYGTKLLIGSRNVRSLQEVRVGKVPNWKNSKSFQVKKFSKIIESDQGSVSAHC